MIQALLPHDEHFYEFFEESAANLVNAALTLRELAAAPAEKRPEFKQRITDLEHAGDSVTHKVFGELNVTFVTPFDREDIHLLASKLDDVMDNMYGAAGRFILYKLNGTPKEVSEMIELIYKSVVQIEEGIKQVRHIHKSNTLGVIIERVNQYENDADDLFEQAVARLFETEKDPITVIKIKELLVTLETATDCCEDVANVLESLLVKHA